MKFRSCFGGTAAIAADDDEAAAAALADRQRGHQRRSLASSFRRKFLSGRKGGTKNKPSPRDENTRDAYADSVVYGGASTASSSVPSSAPLSSAASSSSLSSSRSSSVSSSSSFLRALPPPRTPKGQARQAAGAAAVVLCLLMVVFCGRVGATLVTSTALYLLPRRRWPEPVHNARRGVDLPAEWDDAVSSSASEAEEETAKRKKAVREGSSWRNRKQSCFFSPSFLFG